MIRVDDQLLEYLFQLANLSISTLSQKQKVKLKRDLNSILGYINKLNQIDTRDIPVFHRPYPLDDIGHDDQVQVSNLKLQFPQTHHRYLIVKRVIDKDNEN